MFMRGACVPRMVVGMKKELLVRSGKARTGILLWLLGVPIPIILLIFLVRSCVG